MNITASAPSSTAADVAALLDEPPARPLWRRPSLWLAISLLALAAAGAWFWQARQVASAAPRYVSEPVARGNLTLSVTANGTLQPTRSVSIGSSLTQLLRERRKLADDDDDNFNVLDTQQLAETLSGTTQVMTTLLGAVAAVSLLVGGIGIMNIMLVSVTERTREIGLRLAIGALEREVLLQFLIEAVVLAALGGIVGIVLATGASIILAQVMQVPYLFNPTINLLSFVFSAGIGVVFGYFPARRAAQLDPIEALRHE